MTREEAKGNLIHAIRWNDMPKKEALEMAIKALKQEPKTGHWYYDEEREATGIYAICSNCNEAIYQTGDFKYCPNCGCRMVEPTGAESEVQE